MRWSKSYKNFELEEFIYSATAEARGIDNTPSDEVVQHLEELVATILQPLRDVLGVPMVVTSGYRCEELNRAVGGSATSAHLRGFAADIQFADMRLFGKYVEQAERWLREEGIPFDQSIVEESKTARWWHIAVRNNEGKQRRQFLALNV